MKLGRMSHRLERLEELCGDVDRCRIKYYPSVVMLMNAPFLVASASDIVADIDSFFTIRGRHARGTIGMTSLTW